MRRLCTHSTSIVHPLSDRVHGKFHAEDGYQYCTGGYGADARRVASHAGYFPKFAHSRTE